MPLHALRFSSGTILTHVLLMAGLTSVILSWWTLIYLISTIQNDFDLFDLRILNNMQLLHPYIINISAKHWATFFRAQLFSLLSIWDTSILFLRNRYISSHLSLSVLWKPANSQVLFAWCTRDQKVEVRQGWKGEQSSNPQVATEICIWAIRFTLRIL